MRRSFALLTLVLAFGVAACAAKKEESTTPTLPAAGGQTPGGVGVVTTASTTPPSTFKPTEECSALNAFRMAEFGAGMAPTESRQKYGDALVGAGATVKAKAPDIAARVRELVMMGGAYFEVGNITPAAEFNIYVDPEAADIVLTSGIPIVMIPLDVTHGVLSFQDRLDGFAGLGNKAGKAVAEMLTFSQRFDLDKYGSEGAPLHDPCVIAWLLKPGLFEGRQINVTIETASELTLGMTVADYWRITDRPKNVLYLRSADDKGFYALLNERLARLP